MDREKSALPDHTIVGVSCESRDEAHFISGLLNSSPAQVAVTGYIVLHPSPHVLENVSVPKFAPRDKTHARLSELSLRCHAAAAKGDTETVARLEDEIDRAAAKLWGITDDELKTIQDSLIEMSATHSRDERNEVDSDSGDE